MAARVAYWPLITLSCSGRQPAHMSRAPVSWLPASNFLAWITASRCMRHHQASSKTPVNSGSFEARQAFIGNRSCHSADR
jgi:hypothetical protein